jgi:hypothetical protein
MQDPRQLLRMSVAVLAPYSYLAPRGLATPNALHFSLILPTDLLKFQVQPRTPRS